MAHDIDEVWKLCKDIQTDLSQLKPIKSKCDEIINFTSESESWRICTLCIGNGQIPIEKFPNPPVLITCPQCKGEKVEIITVVRDTAANARIEFGL